MIKVIKADKKHNKVIVANTLFGACKQLGLAGICTVEELKSLGYVVKVGA